MLDRPFEAGVEHLFRLLFNPLWGRNKRGVGDLLLQIRDLFHRDFRQRAGLDDPSPNPDQPIRSVGKILIAVHILEFDVAMLVPCQNAVVVDLREGDGECCFNHLTKLHPREVHGSFILPLLVRSLYLLPEDTQNAQAQNRGDKNE